MPENEWAPHAEKEWGRLTHALGRKLPARMRAVRRAARATRAAASRRKGAKGR